NRNVFLSSECEYYGMITFVLKVDQICSNQLNLSPFEIWQLLLRLVILPKLQKKERGPNIPELNPNITVDEFKRKYNLLFGVDDEIQEYFIFEFGFFTKLFRNKTNKKEMICEFMGDFVYHLKSDQQSTDKTLNMEKEENKNADTFELVIEGGDNVEKNIPLIIAYITFFKPYLMWLHFVTFYKTVNNDILTISMNINANKNSRKLFHKRFTETFVYYQTETYKKNVNTDKKANQMYEFLSEVLYEDLNGKVVPIFNEFDFLLVFVEIKDQNYNLKPPIDGDVLIVTSFVNYFRERFQLQMENFDHYNTKTSYKSLMFLFIKLYNDWYDPENTIFVNKEINSNIVLRKLFFNVWEKLLISEDDPFLPRNEPNDISIEEYPIQYSIPKILAWIIMTIIISIIGWKFMEVISFGFGKTTDLTTERKMDTNITTQRSLENNYYMTTIGKKTNSIFQIFTISSAVLLVVLIITIVIIFLYQKLRSSGSGSEQYARLETTAFHSMSSGNSQKAHRTTNNNSSKITQIK
ncbi:hypothetical protein BLOT_008584, partial [Blomia tropicalis]